MHLSLDKKLLIDRIIPLASFILRLEPRWHVLVIKKYLENSKRLYVLLSFRNVTRHTPTAFSFEMNLYNFPSCNWLQWTLSSRQTLQAATTRHFVMTSLSTTYIIRGCFQSSFCMNDRWSALQNIFKETCRWDRSWRFATVRYIQKKITREWNRASSMDMPLW